MGKERAPGVKQLMTQLLEGQSDLCGKVDGLRDDFSDFKVEEATKNATQDANIAGLQKGVSGAFKEINTHKESHTGFAVKLLIGVSAMVGIIMSAAGFLAYFSNAAKAAGAG